MIVLSAKHNDLGVKMDLEYGKWCTVSGKRWMITDWTRNSVTVWDADKGQGRQFDRSVVTEVSDFQMTDAERKAKGYVFYLMAQHNEPVTQAIRDKRMELCMTKVTLNGVRARVSGIQNSFATVTQFGTGLSAEWSWEAVERIVAKGGDFKS
jgi:hypothetical protein